MKVKVDAQSYNGMLNIGFKPTVDGSKRTIEVHLFNFEADIYGREIVVEFVKALRKEMKFDNIEELKAQLQKDKKAAMEILS